MNKLQPLFVRASSVLLIGLMTTGLLGALPVIPVSASTTSTTATFTPVADAFVNSTYPSTNYGTKTVLKADASPVLKSFARFSVSGLSGLTITNARLKVYATVSSTSGLTVKPVSNNTWGETTITYGNMPAAGTSLGTSLAVTAGTWMSVDVTSYVKAAGTYSFAISTPSSTGVSFDSRETSTYAPRLVLTLGSSTTSNSGIQHVFMVLMENHSYNEVWNTGSTPYITSLGKSYVRATAYHATGHPSLPDYLELYGGSNYGITTDCSPSSSCHINATNLADNLDAKGLTWKGYMESMPSPCYITTSGTYAPKHNPFVYFDDIRTNSTRCKSHVVAFSALAMDLGSASTTPNYVFITPNQCNDMHSCSISTGDNWLKSHIPAILNSPACTVDKCLIAVTWDEDDSSQSNQVLTIFAGTGAKTGGVTSAVSYTHYSLLRTVEYIFGLPTQTTRDAAASPMTDMLR